MSEVEIRERVALTDGSVANFAGPVSTIEEMYPQWESADGHSYVSPEFYENGIKLQAFNSTLRFNLISSDTEAENLLAVSGNTVPRQCPLGAISCESCAVTGLSVAEQAARNCARGNTTIAFEEMEVPAEGRFMLLPTSPNVLILGDENPGNPEMNNGELIYQRLASAQAVVMTEGQMKARGLEKAGFALNGADSTFAVATMEILGEKVAIPFCSTRENMGDRGEDQQILRKAIDQYIDSIVADKDAKKAIIEQLDVSVVLGASATLKNFAHKIKFPSESEDAQPKEKKIADEIKQKWGKITNAGVLDQQYPGALERGNIWPEFEAEIVDLARSRGEDINSPITPDNCPGDGQTCHVDYRKETKYAVETQLVEMGVRSINYDDSHAMDPADINNMASNRREQNNGVQVSKTNRTLNGFVLSFGSL